MQAADQGFAGVLTMTFPMARGFQAERDRAYQGFAELAGDAQAAGKVRADFVPEDLVILLMANAGVVAGTASAAPGTWRRFAAYMMQAFSAASAEPLPPPPTPDACPVRPDTASRGRGHGRMGRSSSKARQAPTHQ